METNIPTEEEMEQEYARRAQTFEAPTIEESVGQPDLDWAYGPLHNLVKMVALDYEDFVLLDAPGGIGKTYNIEQWLNEEGVEWTYQAGHTSPLALYRTLYRGRHDGVVIFLDDMSGISKSSKCVNLLKAATDTQGDENWVSWKSSRAPTLDNGTEIPQEFCFRGKIIMSFNETPDGGHWDALASRGQDYTLDFTYDERLRILREVIKNPHFSALDYETCAETVDWIEHVTDESMDVNIRTLEKVLNIREACLDGVFDEWEMTALDVFDLDYHKYLIIELFEQGGSIEEQRAIYTEKTGRSERHYYDKKNELKSAGRIGGQ